jgi:hypothetical protein
VGMLIVGVGMLRVEVRFKHIVPVLQVSHNSFGCWHVWCCCWWVACNTLSGRWGDPSRE